MKIKHKGTLLGILAVVVGVGMFGAALVHMTWYPVSGKELSVPVVEVPAAPQDVAPEEVPVRLRIPAIHVDANVQQVGVAASGNMAVPNNFTDVGWYRLGTVPGYVGSAVMDGHVDNALGFAGVFKDLSKLRPGDVIEVETQGGEVRLFTVLGSASYPYRDVPLQLLFNRADKPRLNLVTCDGAWIQGEKSYERRLVVFAELR